MRRVWLGLVVLAGSLVVGCGSDGGARSLGKAPAALVGTYATTLTEADLARNSAPQLREGPSWQLIILNTGGPASGRNLTLLNKGSGPLEAAEFGVSGDRIVLMHERCTVGGFHPYSDNEYRFALTGTTLRFTKVSNGCRDRVAETVLTSEPWKKQRGG